MNYLILVITVSLLGCAQLIQGQMQPVKPLGNNLYVTNCGGAAETWGTCNEKAMQTCENGYNVVSKFENSTGISRELKFECKK
jgi:hypothetical protein